jgi:hypothetical protein
MLDLKDYADILAGATGGLVRALVLEEKQWGGFIRSVLVGSVCAFYFGDLMILQLFLNALTEDPDVIISTHPQLNAFVAGVMGIGIISFLINIFDAVKSFVNRKGR